DNVFSAAGQVPDKPRVHRPESKVAVLGSRPPIVELIEDPTVLRRRALRINDSPQAVCHFLSSLFRGQTATNVRRSAALPNVRGADGPAGRAVPDDGSLALVRDAQRLDVLGS